MPVPTRRRPAPALTRRAAVAGLVAVGVAGTSACDPDRSGQRSGPGVSSASGAPGENDDVALVHRVTAELEQALGLTTAAVARYGSLTDRVGPFADLHRAHLEALDRTPSDATASAAPAPGLHSARAALREVTRRERLLQDRLADAAVAAASGTLARLLASMSAAVAQRLAAGGEPGAGAA